MSDHVPSLTAAQALAACIVSVGIAHDIDIDGMTLEGLRPEIADKIIDRLATLGYEIIKVGRA